MEYLGHLRREGVALLIGAQSAGLDTPIDACPGWDTARLVGHTAKIFQRTAVVVSESLSEPPDNDRFPRFASDEGVFDQYSESLDQLLDALAAADPEGPSWNFTGQNLTNAFWQRRMLHETSIHRWDVEIAGGHASEFPADLAVDGIDELLTVLIPMSAALKKSTLDASFHLHCTDTDGEWLTVFTAGKPDTIREHAKGDLAVRGPASSLYLWGWNRRSATEGGLEALGDTTLLESWAGIVP
jgi:uncharacterized protein (TIGR03083 family)